MMSKKIEDIEADFRQAMKKASSLEVLETIKKRFSGKDSPLNEILRSLHNVDSETRQDLGAKANKLRLFIATSLNEKFEHFNQLKLNEKLKKDQIDVSLPGMNLSFGTQHPLNLVIEEIGIIFRELGYELVDGTEVESDLYNFQKLNLPKSHPARDMQDTFYLNDELVMRTHATNMTSRMLTALAKKPVSEQNVAALSYGNVYRRDDDDATHSHQFMQIDGFAVGPKVSFANLK
jgi:phenylalanyl-tRNA synthetase alpha chain